jgi:hypothetical protein
MEIFSMKNELEYEYGKELQLLRKKIEKINNLNNYQTKKAINEQIFWIYLPLGKHETEKTNT